MEKVHDPESRPWISEVKNPKKFLEEWLSATEGFPIGFQPGEPDWKELYSLITKDSKEEIEELEALFDETNLRCPYEDDIDVARRSCKLPDDIKLETVKSQAKDMERRVNDRRYRGFVYSNKKFYNYPQSVPFAIKQRTAVMQDENNRIPLPDVILTVQIYRPEQAITRYQKKMLARTPSFHVDQEFWVLGSQCLTELRDKISCVSDYAVATGDVSDNPDQKHLATTKDIYKSGFFYINGVFYNDMRDPCAVDCSKTVMDWWLENPERGVGPFSIKKMEETKFIDLEFQMGYPYLYMHQGDCEHIMVICDMRVATASDSCCKADYPLISRYVPKKRMLCMVCHIETTKWVVSKNKKLPEDPYFFCDQCFKLFHYDKDMNKLMDFEARRYICRSTLD